VKRERERVYNEAIRVCGESTRFARKEGGSASKSFANGGEAYKVVSRVIRRMSHFRRCEANGSGDGDGGGCMSAKADVRRE
jgi:hypothetical protein